MKLELLPIVERFECKYFAENDIGDGEILNLALQSPFIRLYALNADAKTLEKQKQRFQDNERVQLFQRTHAAAWFELVRIVPSDQPAVFWVHPVENVGRCLSVVARQRPRREDVLVFEVGRYHGVLQMAERFFGHTHRLDRSGRHDGRRWSPNPSTWDAVPAADELWVAVPRAAGR